MSAWNLPGNQNNEELGRMRSPWQYLLLATAVVAISDPVVRADRFRLLARRDPTVTPTPVSATSAEAARTSHAAASDSDGSTTFGASTADSSAAAHTSPSDSSSADTAKETSGSHSLSTTIATSLVASSTASSAPSHGMETFDKTPKLGRHTKSCRYESGS